MDKVYELKEWSVIYTSKADDFFKPPEMMEPRLSGSVYGHARFEDGSAITTSRIKDATGRVITTQNDSKYKLVGPPAKEYVKYLESINYKYDEENPIKVK